MLKSYFASIILEKRRIGSGSAPLTYGFGSGSWRPKNMRVLRIRIRIPNTGFVNIDAAEEGRRWQEAELRRKDETFAAAEEKRRRQVTAFKCPILLCALNSEPEFLYF